MNEKNYEIPEEELNKASGGMLLDSEENDMLNRGECPICGNKVTIFTDNGVDYTCRYGHKYHRYGSVWGTVD